jgi:hypothetical protein
MAPEKDLGQAGWSVLVMIFGYADLRFPATILRYDPRVTETERAAVPVALRRLGYSTKGPVLL